jgi:prepilin-type processing-associated H-X9-DG protein
MLLPALNKARSAAKTVQCLSNLKQLALGCQMYANENGGYLPWAIGRGSGNSYYVPSRYWFSMLAPRYLNQAVFVCPADQTPNDWATTLGQYSSTRVDDFPISYGYSRVLGNAYRQALLASNPTAVRQLEGKKLSAFNGRSGPRSNPTTAILLFDYANIGFEPGGPYPINNKTSGDASYGVDRLSARHGNGLDSFNLSSGLSIPTKGLCNFAFIDGHAESIAAPFGTGQFSLLASFNQRYGFAGDF